MRKLVIAGNILSTIPAALVVPLMPFTFFLIEGEGRIPGYFHEYLVHVLMLGYPMILLICLWLSRRTLLRNQPKPALVISLIPLSTFMLLLWTFLEGGVIIR